MIVFNRILNSFQSGMISFSVFRLKSEIDLGVLNIICTRMMNKLIQLSINWFYSYPHKFLISYNTNNSLLINLNTNKL
jgi:hypothetical protein